MEHYVTLFDSLFLPQGLALHSSMEQYAGKYTLWILCVDEIAYDVLTRLNLPNVRLIRLTDVETPELKKVKQERTKGEYCWTLAPFAPRFVFENDPDVQRVTYLDADLWFLKSPQPIFDEFEASKKHVLITDHAYAPEYDQSAISGQYCVQFVTFNRIGGEVVRSHWEKQCIEWCYARVENGKFGDQKYWDFLVPTYSNIIHVLNKVEWILAPWNLTRFPYSSALVYHFHGLRILSKSRLFLSAYSIPYNCVTSLYNPYAKTLREVLIKLELYDFSFRPFADSIALISSGLWMSFTSNLKKIVSFLHCLYFRF